MTTTHPVESSAPSAAFLRPLRLPLLALAITVGLAGCATIQDARDPLSSQPEENEGSVVLSLTVNTGEVTQFDRIFLRRLQDPPKSQSGIDRSYQLRNALPGLSRDTSLFIGLLPEGDYEFVSLHDDQTLKFLRINEKQAELLGSFGVHAGQVTDLGRMVLTAINFGVVVGRSNALTSNRSLVADFAPDYLRLFASMPSAGWTQPRREQDVAEAFAMIHPQGAGGFSELASGEVIGGTRMGTVTARGRDGKWRVLARLDSLNAILATVPYEAGDNLAVVAGELGTLARVDRQGYPHPVALGDLPRGNLFFVDHSPNGGEWIVGVQSPREAALYRATQLDNGHWEKLRGDTVEFSFWNGARNVWAWSRPGGIGFASTQSRQLACYDYANRQWREHGSPDERLITALAASPGDVVGVLSSPGGGFGGVFAKTHYSRDCGGQWVETDSPYKVKVMPPLVLPAGEILETGGVFGDKGAYASADGRTWSKLSDEVSFSEAVSVLPTAGLLGVSRGNLGIENIQHSADGGRSWKTELTSIDYRLLKKDQAAKQ